MRTARHLFATLQQAEQTCRHHPRHLLRLAARRGLRASARLLWPRRTALALRRGRRLALGLSVHLLSDRHGT